ncbi:MAG: NAD(P)-dependent alcohol dehydrogenase [Clostridia bacterium]|nr:NAD(P)-dependent alcohol dehydrogenase [Clostridia bacterium]
MKAVVYDKGISPDALVFREVEKPTPRDNEVLVKIAAVSVNAADIRSMKMGIIPKRKIFGSDIAGRVEAVGKNIHKFSVGDEVFGDISACGLGGFAEYVAVPEKPLALKPVTVSFEAAAAVPMSAVTALQALRNKGNIELGQKVMVYGAGGGVGTFAIQLAKHFGVEVTAICSARNEQLVRSLGTDHVIDYTKEDCLKSGKRYDLILAVNGYQPLSAYKRALNPRGTAVIVGGALSQVIKAMLLGPLMSLGDRKIRILAAKPDAKDLEFIIRLVEAGKIKPVIEKSYPLSETAEAVRYLGEGHARGKVIINIMKE